MHDNLYQFFLVHTMFYFKFIWEKSAEILCLCSRCKRQCLCASVPYYRLGTCPYLEFSSLASSALEYQANTKACRARSFYSEVHFICSRTKAILCSVLGPTFINFSLTGIRKNMCAQTLLLNLRDSFLWVMGLID